MNFTFRPITINDAKKMREWAKINPFVKEWYYLNKLPHITTIERKLNNKINDSNMYAYIVKLNDVEIGYIQHYPVDSKTPWGKKVYLHNNTVSIDYHIGDINYIHKGYGPQMILSYIDQIIRPQRYDYAIITPDPDNQASNRCCVKCGFEYIKTVNVPYNNSKMQEAIYLKKL